MIYRACRHRYEGSKHGSQGYFFLACAVAISALDVFSLVARLVHYVQSVRAGEERFAVKTLWSYVVLDRDEHLPAESSEYTNLVQDPDDMDEAELKAVKDVDEEAVPIHVRRARVVEPIRTDVDMDGEHHETANWAQNVHRHSRQHSYPHSAASERTLFGGPHSPRHSDEALHETGYIYPWQGKKGRELLKVIGRAVFATAERSLVFAGLMQVVTGVIIYTGGCRGNYLNGCLAHLISKHCVSTWRFEVSHRSFPQRVPSSGVTAS